MFDKLKKAIGLDKTTRTSVIIDRTRRNHETFLDLSSQDFSELPETIGRLLELRKLDLSYNQLSELPKSIGQLSELQTLRILSNRLRKLPESIGQLSQLRIFDLSNNRLTELPETIGQLPQLRTLNLLNNQLRKLPKSVGQLSQLDSLDLTSNGLSELPETIGQLPQLRTLNLLNNRLSKLPETMGQLSQIQNITLSDNQLSELPEAIGQLPQLQGLHVSGNLLSKLPETIGQLPQLRTLNLSNNRLTELPESIGQLAQLEILDLSNNRLSELPETLRNLKFLKELILHGNNALSLPAEVLGPFWQEVALGKAQATNPTDILEYYFRVRGGSRPLNEAKLILVGRGAVGKTSIVNRLVHNIFKDEKRTEGINITDWRIQLHTNEDVRLNVWDFGGQEIMHATHQFFLTQRSIYLLVLNGREGGEDEYAEYWLKLIESFGDESPVIVVLNKIKEHPFDLNRNALQRKYPAIRKFIRTDCQDGTGFNQLIKAIEQETDRLEHLRDAFPASWFTIKDQLKEIKKNYLSFSEYRDVCAQHGETDRTAQELLTVYLHNLGIALNYKDDPRLQDTHVLNPHWVTNGIYKVLNSERLERQKGEIHLKDLSGILDEGEYPYNMHRFIFDLMKKFEICFSFPDNDTHYLIPELLDKQEPEQASEFKLEECLNFQYHYTVLPEGLLPRFIVRTHVLSEGLSRWRTGVILKFGDSKALVRADGLDRKVFISVFGPAASRRELLAVIRSDFERIHNDIRNLNPLQMIPVPDYPDVVVPYEELLVMERSGMKKFPKVADGKVIELDVQELLNGVDVEGARRTQRATEERIRRTETNAVRVFISYSHKDDNLRNELQTHLKLLHRQGIINAWDDRRIDAGDEWRRKVNDNLERADIILLLVSADFIASDYAYEIEMKRALERHDKNEARVIPVIVRDVSWGKAPFGELQALPKEGKAISLWPDKDVAWHNVSEGIEKVAEQLRRKSWQ